MPSQPVQQLDLTQWMEEVRHRLPSLVIDATNQPILEAVGAYFLGNEAECRKRGIKRQKGLFLVGPVGCGKTTIMQRLASQPVRLVATRDIARKFVKEGNNVLEHYGTKSYRIKHLGYGPVVQYDQPITYCFDDLGVEQNAKLYGNGCNVMAEILLDRYEQFIRHGMITHLTTNLNADELERLYGDRVRSRLREMCNLICFPAEAPDRRTDGQRTGGRQPSAVPRRDRHSGDPS